MKKMLILVLTVGVLLISSLSAFAAPTDGGTSLNITSRSTDFKVDGSTKSDTTNEYALSYNSLLGTTYKLKYGKTSSDQYKFHSLEGNYYKGVGNGLSLILGMRNYGLEEKATDKSKNKFTVQAGAEYKQNLAKNTFGYASVLLGSKLTDYEIGLGYKLTNNLTLDVNYRDLQIDDIHVNNRERDVENKGWGFGLSLNF